MSRVTAGCAVIAALCLFALSGCNKNEDLQGGPGANPALDAEAREQHEERTFTPSLSEETMELKPGQREELTLSIDRGDEFNQKVAVEFKMPEGIKVLPERVEILGGDTETKVLLETEQQMEAGHELPIEITFQPEAGKAVSKVLKVTVQPRDEGQSEEKPNAERPSAEQPSASQPAAPEPVREQPAPAPPAGQQPPAETPAAAETEPAAESEDE